MSEILTFHFEGALADGHRMNFYEAARFQYAAARLMVKLAQFRHSGKFVQKITAKSNFDIQLSSQSDGSFNINVEDANKNPKEEDFIKISLSDLIAYVSERVIEKIDEAEIEKTATSLDHLMDGGGSEQVAGFEKMVEEIMEGQALSASLPISAQDLVKRRVAEVHREHRLEQSKSAISRIDAARSQKLIAMSAPLLSEMATALRKSADTLEIRSSVHGTTRPVLFLDRKMAQDIETAIVDKEITPILGDITQFNKDNGWGKLKIENGTKTVSFSIPYDILPTMKQKLIDNMKKDLVYLQTYFVRDQAGEVTRLIAVGILPTPDK